MEMDYKMIIEKLETKTIEERRMSIEVWDCRLVNAVAIIAATQGRRDGPTASHQSKRNQFTAITEQAELNDGGL